MQCFRCQHEKPAEGSVLRGVSAALAPTCSNCSTQLHRDAVSFKTTNSTCPSSGSFDWKGSGLAWESLRPGHSGSLGRTGPTKIHSGSSDGQRPGGSAPRQVSNQATMLWLTRCVAALGVEEVPRRFSRHSLNVSAIAARGRRSNPFVVETNARRPSQSCSW